MGDAGGWLPDVRRWFVHLHCWPELRRGLLGAGCTVADGADPLTVAGALARAEGRATVELVAVRERVQRAVSGLRASGERPDVQRLLQDWAVQLEERGAPAEGHRTMLRLLEAAEGMLE